MKLINLILSLSSILALSNPQVEEDPCTVISKKTIYTYEETLACLNNFPLDAENKRLHLSTLKKQIPFYAFEDIVKHSPENKLASEIDLIKELTKLESKSHKTELELHRDLIKLFTKLHDGHTVYFAACAYYQSYRQPFPLTITKDENGNHLVKVLDQVKLSEEHIKYWNSQGVNVTKYFGKTVLLVDQQLPLDYLNIYADKYIPGSRDANSRLNLALARPFNSFGTWGMTYGAHVASNVIPDKSSITYTFKVGYDEEKITVPYLVTGPGGFADSGSFYNRYCSVNPSERFMLKENKERKVDPKYKVQQVEQVIETKIDEPFKQTKDNKGLNQPLTNGFFIQSYLVNENVAVLNLPTFAPAGIDYFINEATDALNAFKEKKVKKLIIDVSNNGGGIICLGYWLAEYFFPKNNNNLYFTTDQKQSNIFKKLVIASNDTGAFHDVTRWLKPDKTPFKDSQEFLTERKIRRGNSDGIYTQLFIDNCPANPFEELIKNNDYNNPFDAKDITIISNGVCYSTCTLFSNNLQLVNKVNTILVGGDHLRSGSIASLAGGTVYNIAYVLNDLQAFDLLNEPDSPQYPPFKISLSYTSRQAYPDSSAKIPLEFTWIPANKRIPYSKESLLDPFKVWEQVAKLV